MNFQAELQLAHAKIALSSTLSHALTNGDKNASLAALLLTSDTKASALMIPRIVDWSIALTFV